MGTIDVFLQQPPSCQTSVLDCCVWYAGPGLTRGYGMYMKGSVVGSSSPASGALLCFVQSCGRCAARHPTEAGYEAGSHEALHSLSSTVHCTYCCVCITDVSLLGNTQAQRTNNTRRTMIPGAHITQSQ